MKGIKKMNGYYTEYRKNKKFKKDLKVDSLNEIDHAVNEQIHAFAVGKKHAIAGWELKQKFGIKKDSEFQAIIERLRNSNLKGAPICACNKGYFVPATRDEFIEWLESYEFRALKMIHTATNARKKWNDLFPERIQGDE